MAADMPPPDKRLEDLAEKLRGVHERCGLPLPDDLALSAPVLYVGAEGRRPPIQRLARAVSELLAGKDLLFMRAEEVGEIDAVTGKWAPMTPQVFVTWIYERGGILPVKDFKKDEATLKSVPVEGELGVEQARLILASANFRAKLPIVERINRVKLPVMREERDERGLRKIELLQPGYDVETLTFTALGDGDDYDEMLDPAKAVEWLKLLTRDFPWGDEERSRAVFVCAFLTLFCRNLYNGKAPMFIFVSNLPGSGKSMLTQICIAPVMGDDTAASGWNRDDRQETRKELDATAQEFAPYLWFDDVDRCKVASTDLNRWLTARAWACRMIGTGVKFKGPLYAATFLTGNGVTADDNLERRSLWVDLFARQASNERDKAQDRIELNDAFFESKENMAQCLAVMWALVRWWDEGASRTVTKQRAIESFEGWSEVVPSIAEAAGFRKSLARYEAPDAGNAEGKEWRALAAALIAEHCTAKEAKAAIVTMRDVIRTARLQGLFQEVLMSLEQVVRELDEKAALKRWKWKAPAATGGGDEFGLDDDADADEISEEEKRLQAAEWSDRKMDSTWAKAWRKAAVAGQWFKAADGHVYVFGDRSSHKGSRFEIRRVEKKTTPAG